MHNFRVNCNGYASHAATRRGVVREYKVLLIASFFAPSLHIVNVNFQVREENRKSIYECDLAFKSLCTRPREEE
jgi:hypothetical protein